MSESESPGSITLLLNNPKKDRDWENELLWRVQDDLYAIAKRHLNQERPGHLLDTMMLVDDACLKLLKDVSVSWKNRQHFFAFAKRVVKQLLIDAARSKSARDGRLKRVPLGNGVDVEDRRSPAADDALCLHNAIDGVIREALERMSSKDPSTVGLAKIVQLYYLDGQTWEQVALLLGFSVATAKRRRDRALAHLRCEIANESWDHEL